MHIQLFPHKIRNACYRVRIQNHPLTILIFSKQRQPLSLSQLFRNIPSFYNHSRRLARETENVKDYSAPTRTCFKKSSSLHISTEIFPLWFFYLLYQKSREKFSFHPSTILMTFYIGLPLRPTKLCLPFISSYFINAKAAFHQCTVQISFITVRFVHHCMLKQALAPTRQWLLSTTL